MSGINLVRSYAIQTLRQSVRFALILMLIGPVSVLAQQVELPKINIPAQEFAPTAKPSGPVLSDPHSIKLGARLTDSLEPISDGLYWRIFALKANEDGSLPLVAEYEGGSANLVLEDGAYIAHVAFGHAGATRKFNVNGADLEEVLSLNAGGLVLNGALPGSSSIIPSALRFSVYEEEEDATGSRPLIAENVEPGTIVRLKAGNYHIVSEYGTVNARLRADIRVEAGRIIEATIEHRASQLSLKLARIKGGQALPGTQWSVYNESGDTLMTEVGPYATIILAEGNYNIVAQNRGRTFERLVTLDAGENLSVEILTSTDQ